MNLLFAQATNSDRDFYIALAGFIAGAIGVIVGIVSALYSHNANKLAEASNNTANEAIRVSTASNLISEESNRIAKASVAEAHSLTAKQTKHNATIERLEKIVEHAGRFRDFMQDYYQDEMREHALRDSMQTQIDEAPDVAFVNEVHSKTGLTDRLIGMEGLRRNAFDKIREFIASLNADKSVLAVSYEGYCANSCQAIEALIGYADAHGRPIYKQIPFERYQHELNNLVRTITNEYGVMIRSLEKDGKI